MKANEKQVGGLHYKARMVQHWDYACQLPYLDGQVSKYVDRHSDKGGFQDLLKAEHYLHKMMEVYYPEEYAAHLNPPEGHAITSDDDGALALRKLKRAASIGTGSADIP